MRLVAVQDNFVVARWGVIVRRGLMFDEMACRVVGLIPYVLQGLFAFVPV